MTAVSFTIQDSKNWDFLLAKLNLLSAAAGAPGGSAGQVQYNNAGALGGFTVSGDGTLVTATGVLTVTKLNGVSPGSFFSGTDAANLTGSLSLARLANQGTTTTVLHGNAAGTPVFGAVVEADITLANNTTNNVSTSKHGFAPILPNDATKYFDGTGAYSVPSGGSSGANPTATASDVAVNGIAATFMRSDAAPAVQKGSASVFGVVKADGTTITATGGVLTAVVSGGGILTQLAQVTTTAGQASVTVMNSIPGSYKNLILTMRGGSSGSATNNTEILGLQFNGDTGNHYSHTGLGSFTSNAFGNGAGSIASAGVGLLSMTGATNVPVGYTEVTIPDYTQTASPVEILSRSTGTQQNVGILQMRFGARWIATSFAAITAIVAINQAGTAFKTGTVFTLYGQS